MQRSRLVLFRSVLWACACTWWVACAAAQELPAAVEAALARAKVPRDAVTLMVVDAQGNQAPRLAYRANTPVNPASIAKLITTFWALEQLGPAFAWRTPVYADGPVRNGTLSGNLYIRGQGDPKLVAERLWLLMRRVQGLGIRQIAGDIVLDRTAFELAAPDPGAFDGEPLRPYNAAPDALLINFKSLELTFSVERSATTARVHVEPSLADVQVQNTVGLSSGECGDWRQALKADFSDPTRIRFAGTYAASCGERVWPIAYADPASHARRAVAGMWAELGGKLTGQVRDGKTPPGLKPSFEVTSPPLAEVVRDINKYSNNVMAQQLFLTLSLQGKGVGSFEGSREGLRTWWRERIGDQEPPPIIENGSGLSRQDRLTAQALARLLQAAWASPLMPELMSSLPVTGIDGTMRRSRRIGGLAHLKTGSLRDVAGIAGYVHGASGRRYVLIAIANHASAAAARPAMEALVEWAAADHPP